MFNLTPPRSNYFNHIIQWIIGGTRGGLNRAKIINVLSGSPMNANQLSKELELDYGTIRHHLEVLEKDGLITSLGDGYGVMYFLSDNLLDNYGFFEEIWEKIGKKIKKEGGGEDE